MMRLASLTNDNEIECISALLADQTDMTNKSSWSLEAISGYYALSDIWLISCCSLTDFVAESEGNSLPLPPVNIKWQLFIKEIRASYFNQFSNASVVSVSILFSELKQKVMHLCVLRDSPNLSILNELKHLVCISNLSEAQLKSV